MDFNFGWLVSLVGVVFVWVIAEMIIPHRRIGGAVRICVMIVLVSVLFSSVVEYAVKDRDEEGWGADAEVVANESYFSDMVKNLESMAERKILAQLGLSSDVYIEFEVVNYKIQYLSVNVELLQGLGTRKTEEVVAIVVPKEELYKKYSSEEVEKMVKDDIKILSSQLTQYKRPSTVIIKKEPLPRTTTRKVKRNEVKKLVTM